MGGDEGMRGRTRFRCGCGAAYPFAKLKPAADGGPDRSRESPALLPSACCLGLGHGCPPSISAAAASRERISSALPGSCACRVL